MAGLWDNKLLWRAAQPQAPQPHEATLLHLDSSRAADGLGWRPRWGIDRALAMTVEGYRALIELPPGQARAVLVGQIETYFQ
jgi:CDP-glucose 4,6-dehydratase